jgi:hypothetical protein
VISGLWAAVCSGGGGDDKDAGDAGRLSCDAADRPAETADSGFLCSADDPCKAVVSDVHDDPHARASKSSLARIFLSEAVASGTSTDKPLPLVAGSLVQRWRSSVLQKPDDMEHLCVRPSLDRLHLSAFPMHTKCLVLVSNGGGIDVGEVEAKRRHGTSRKKLKEHEEDEHLWRALAEGMASVQGNGHVAFETMRISSTSKTVERLRLPVPKPPLRHHIVALHPVSGSMSILPDWGDTAVESLTAEGIGSWLRRHEASVVYGNS